MYCLELNPEGDVDGFSRGRCSKSSTWHSSERLNRKTTAHRYQLPLDAPMYKTHLVRMHQETSSPHRLMNAAVTLAVHYTGTRPTDYLAQLGSPTRLNGSTKLNNTFALSTPT
jgi:hypothetical protein